MDFLKDFGVQPVLLIAQVVNFLILLFLLRRFLYKPLLKVLDERKAKIAQSLENATQIEERLQKVAQEEEKKLKEVGKKAAGMLEDASKMADQIIARAHDKAALQTAAMMDKAGQQVQLENQKLHQQLRLEVAGMVAEGLRVITGKVLSDKEQKGLIEKSIKELKIR